MPVYKEVSELPRCGSCGKLLGVGGIEVERLGHTVVFCTEKCVQVFDSYKVPKYGEAALWEESIVR
jgi:ribosomal protein L24E